MQGWSRTKTKTGEFVVLSVSRFPSFDANYWCLRNNQDGYGSNNVSKKRLEHLEIAPAFHPILSGAQSGAKNTIYFCRP